MSKTIREIADEFGVSKTAIRNHMNEEFRAKYTEKDCKGVLLVSEEGCKLLANLCGKTANYCKDSANQFAQTPQTEVCTIPRSVLTMLEGQLAEKDRQIAAQQEQIAQLTSALENTTASLQAAQALHAGTMQKQLSDGSEKKTFFSLFRKKGE